MINNFSSIYTQFFVPLKVNVQGTHLSLFNFDCCLNLKNIFGAFIHALIDVSVSESNLTCLAFFLTIIHILSNNTLNKEKYPLTVFFRECRLSFPGYVLLIGSVVNLTGPKDNLELRSSPD